MRQPKPRRLTIRTETIRQLDAHELHAVVGGVPTALLTACRCAPPAGSGG